MELSKRLTAVAGLVTEGASVADIGTDHGYIPIHLIEQGLSPKVIAMDINKGPLERARIHIAGYGMSDRIETRLSDGLAVVEPGEVDEIIVAGMGGGLVIHILEEGKEVVRRLKGCILQPQSEIQKVREYLVEHGFVFEAEDMVEEDGKYYPMMRVIPPKTETSDLISESADGKICGAHDTNAVGESACEVQENTNVVAESVCGAQKNTYAEWEYLYGPLLLKDKNPVLYEYLKREIRIRGDILGGLAGKEGERIKERIAEIEHELEVAEKALAYYEE